jgi:hypothetical protein
MEELIRIALSSCPMFFHAPGVALLLLVARLERHDFRMKRTEDSVSLAIGSKWFRRNILISEMSKSVQNSSVRACIPSVPCGEKRVNQEEIDKLPGENLEANSTKDSNPRPPPGLMARPGRSIAKQSEGRADEIYLPVGG